MIKFINNYLLVYIIDKIKVFNRIGLRNISDFVRYIFYVLKMIHIKIKCIIYSNN